MSRRELTPKLRERILSALRDGFRRPEAADIAGVSTGHILRWLMRGFREKTGTYAEFHRAFYAAEREGRLAAIGAILQAAETGNWDVVLEVMDRSFPPLSGDDGDEVSSGSLIVRAVREAQRAGGRSGGDLWHLVWDRLCADLGRQQRPALDEYDRSALRRLLSAARQGCPHVNR